MKTYLPKPKNIFTWAQRAMRLEKWEEALQRWSVLREAYPNQVKPWIKSAVALCKLCRYKDAAILLAQGIKKFPNNIRLQIQLAEVLMQDNQIQEAVVVWKKIIEQSPEEVLPWVRLSDSYFLLGDMQQAEEVSLQAREKFSDHTFPRVHCAEQITDLKNWNAALEGFHDVREQGPTILGHDQGAVAAERAGSNKKFVGELVTKESGPDWFPENRNENNFETIAVPARRSLQNFLDLVWIKAIFNLKSEASRNKLSYAWWILEPLLYMMVFYIVFTKLLDRGGEGYVAYLLSGIVPFMWFAKSVQIASNSILFAQGLLQKIKIDPLFFPLVSSVQSTLKQIPVFIMLIVFLMLYGVKPGWHWFGLIFIITLQFLLITTSGMLLSLIVPFFKDLQHIIPTLIQFLLFTSGIFFMTDKIPHQWQALFFANPLANIISQYRDIFIHEKWPQWMMLLQLGITIIFIQGIVWMLYKRFRFHYPKAVME